MHIESSLSNFTPLLLCLFHFDSTYFHSKYFLCVQICRKILFVQDAYSDLHRRPSLHITSVAESGKSTPRISWTSQDIARRYKQREKRDIDPSPTSLQAQR